MRWCTCCAPSPTRRSPIPPAPSIPARDAQSMEEELILADLGVAERRLERLEKDLKKGRSPELERERDVVHDCRAALEDGRPLRALELKGEDLKRLRGFQFLSAKPLLIVLNLDEAELTGARRGDDLRAGGRSRRPRPSSCPTPAPPRSPSAPRSSSRSPSSNRPMPRRFWPISDCRNRGSIASFAPATTCSDTFRFSRSAKTSAGPGRFPRGTPAQLAAGEIHSDIARGFIRAEVVSYDALTGRGSMAACRDHGEVRLEGKEYIVQDGDIINFRFATVAVAVDAGHVEHRRVCDCATSVVIPARNEEHADRPGRDRAAGRATPGGRFWSSTTARLDDTAARAAAAGARWSGIPTTRATAPRSRPASATPPVTFVLIIDARRPASARGRGAAGRSRWTNTNWWSGRARPRSQATWTATRRQRAAERARRAISPAAGFPT